VVALEGTAIAETPTTTAENRPRIVKAFAAWGEPHFIAALDPRRDEAKLRAAFADVARPVVVNSAILDELLHTVRDPLPGLARLLATRFATEVKPAIAAVPAERPIVLVADHGFIRKSRGEYAHGGNSIPERLTPLVIWRGRQAE
jgi:hypothetical protein